MINKRFFAFGCSYTEYSYPTWADILGVGFSFYRNYGRGGASNYYIMSKFIEANQMHKFGEGDVVYVMFTGFSRFSYLKKELLSDKLHTSWVTNGELENYYIATKDELVGKFLDGIWTTDLGIYISYIAISTIKTILEKSGAEFRLMLAIDNRDFIKRPKIYSLSSESVEVAKKFYELLDVSYSLDEWRDHNYSTSEWTTWKGGWDELNCPPDRKDAHPSIKMHYDYVKMHFPQLITKFTDEFVETEMRLFNNESQQKQGTDYVNRLTSLHNFRDKTFHMG